MLQLPPLLLLAVTGQASNRATDGARNAVGDARAIVGELALGLLSLALLVLALAFLLQALGADETADSFLGGPDGLVPAAGLAVWVVRCDTRPGDGDAADGGAGVRGRVLGVGLGLLLVGFALKMRSVERLMHVVGRGGGYLVRRVAGDGANDRLGRARGLDVLNQYQYKTGSPHGISINRLPSRCSSEEWTCSCQTSWWWCVGLVGLLGRRESVCSSCACVCVCAGKTCTEWKGDCCLMQEPAVK